MANTPERAQFPLARKVAQDYLQSKRSFNGESIGYVVPPFLRGMVTENGALIATEEAVASAIQRNDPQGYATVIQNIPEYMADASVSGNTINYTKSPDEGEDWGAWAFLASSLAPGVMNGAFSGIGNGVMGGVSGAAGAFGNGPVWGLSEAASGMLGYTPAQLEALKGVTVDGAGNLLRTGGEGMGMEEFIRTGGEGMTSNMGSGPYPAGSPSYEQIIQNIESAAPGAITKGWAASDPFLTELLGKGWYEGGGLTLQNAANAATVANAAKTVAGSGAAAKGLTLGNVASGLGIAGAVNGLTGGGVTRAFTGGSEGGGTDGNPLSAVFGKDGVIDLTKIRPSDLAGVVAALTQNKNNGPSALQQEQVNALKLQQEIAREQWDRYKKVYAPLQDRVVSDAMGVDSPERIEQAAGAAHASVTNSFDSARQQGMDALRRLGVNPGSDKFIDANAKVAVSHGAADAGAQNDARRHLESVGRNYRATVAAGGNPLATQASGGAGSAASGFGGAATQAGAMNRARANGIGSFFNNTAGLVNGVRGFDIGASRDPSSTGWGTGMSERQAQTFEGNADNDVPASSSWDMGDYGTGGSGTSSQWATDYGQGGDGWYADGGIVRGPGTGTSDSIRARGPGGRGLRISNGEFVVPADVVKAKGVEYFNKLVEKYHTPVRGGR